MLSKGSERLAADHVALGRLLKELKTALSNDDVAVSYAKVDLFWAKLAVHIRAEHLHLFPSVLNAVTRADDDKVFVAAMLPETQSAIERLRSDHDFFMKQLADAVEIARSLVNASEEAVTGKGLNAIKEIVFQIEQRLEDHNHVEEGHIYRLSGIVLSRAEQVDLAQRITSELEKRPPRFAANVW